MEQLGAPLPHTAIAGCSIQCSTRWLKQVQGTTLTVLSHSKTWQKSLSGHNDEQKTILIAEGKGSSRSTGLMVLMQPPSQQLVLRSQEAINERTDMQFLPHFLCISRIMLISTWAIRRKIVNTAVITLPLLPFPNNAKFKGILAASCFYDDEASSAPPEFTLGKTRAIDLKNATFISNSKENTYVNDKENLLCCLKVTAH